MNAGKVFENNWKESFKKIDAYYFRIKDSASAFNNGNSSFTRSNPYDCFSLYNKYFFAMELKSTKGSSFTFEKDGSGKGNKMIKKNQIDGLNDVINFKNTFAGFIFNFRSDNLTYWMNIKDFIEFYNNTDKGSINKDDIKKYHGILIKSKKLKVNYRYDIKLLFDNLIRGEYCD